MEYWGSQESPPVCHTGDANKAFRGSNPLYFAIQVPSHGPEDLMGNHCPCTAEIVGSIPIWSTLLNPINKLPTSYDEASYEIYF